MHNRLLQFLLITLTISSLLHLSARAQGIPDPLEIVSFDPKPNQVNVTPGSPVTLKFNQPVGTTDFNQALVLYGERAGHITGNAVLANGDTTVIFTPATPFLVGDRITAVLVRQPSAGAGVLQTGYVWEFDIAPVAGILEFAGLPLSMPLRLTSVVAVELNNDDIADFAFVGSNGSSHRLQLATFQNGKLTPGSFIALPDRVRPLYTADLNRDGLPDFVLIHRGRTKFSIPPRISICFSQANGSLSLEQTFNVANVRDGQAEPRGAIISDLDQDGFLDIVVVVKNEGLPRAAFVYLNDGSGHFATPTLPPWFGRSGIAESIFSRDLNGSGFIDIGIGDSSSLANISLYLNDGEADYNQLAADLLLPGGPRDFEIAKSIDLTGDLWPDVLGVDYAGNEIALFTHQGVVVNLPDVPTPVFSDPPREVPAITNPNWLDYGDLDADGDLDLLLTGSLQNQLQMLVNDNANFLSLEQPISPSPTNFAVADFNGDKALDVAVADTNGQVTLLLNNISGFEPPAAPVLLEPASGSYVALPKPAFRWQTPSDPNSGDMLHFRITITRQGGVPLAYESAVNPELFSPTPPVPQGQGSVSFTQPVNLSEGNYSWFVEAWDGLQWSEPSAMWEFVLDATKPSGILLTFPNADFNGIWFGLSPNESVTAQLRYTETHADRAVVTTDGIGGPFTFTNIPSGANVGTAISFVPATSPDGQYQVRAKIIDRGGLSDSTTATAGVDRNPPSGGLASVDNPVSATRSFRVYWSGGSDGAGSGLSGAYRVQYRKDNGPWTVWINQSSAGDSLFQGQHGSTYQFEAAAFDRVGFVEVFTNTSEAQVTVNVYANDHTPPTAPLNIRANGANPSPWQRTNNFTVRWDPPTDASGIKASFWKLGSAPASNADYQNSGAPNGPAELVLTSDGNVPLYVWLSDSAGNVDYRNNARVYLRRDATAPVVSQLAVTTPAVRYTDASSQPWFKSTEDKNFTVAATYTELHPKKGVLTTDGLTDSLFTSGALLPGGTNVKTNFNFSIVNPAARLYTLKTTVIDSAANSAPRSIKIGLDGAPPQNSLASAPAISATETFIVSWSAGSDGTGSGIAGYDIYSKTGTGAWQLWRQASTAGSATFTGQNGVEYRFESIAKDNVGYAEPFSANGEARVLVDLAANDKQAPPPPINLRANGAAPSPWTNNPAFTITWTKPQDESGVVASYWKLGAAPVSNADTSGIGGKGPAEGAMTVQMTAAGKQQLYVWLIDAKGNVDYHNIASVLLRFDNVAPKIIASRFPTPNYGADWFNQKTTGSTTFETTYHEQFAAGLTLVSSDFNYNITETSLPSGIGAKKTVTLDLTQRVDKIGLLRITVADSAGNKGEATDTLRLDSTPPAGSAASSPAASGNPSFQVSWTAGSDAGVGVADVFDVFVKEDETSWTRWLDDFAGRSAVYTGRDGHSYHFEAVARDWLGNEEVRTYSYESTTLVDVALSDSIAPGAPINLRANNGNPSPWRKIAEFDITWQSPPDPTGTPKGWYKLGSKPVSQTDTTGAFIGNPPLKIRATREHGQMLYVWLQDGAGNSDYRNVAAVNLRYDATPPRIDSLALLNPKPAFAANGNNWYNQTVPPHWATLAVFFQERHAATVLMEPSAYFQTATALPPAGADSAGFSLAFQNAADNSITLKVTLNDSAGNQAQASTLISLDKTPPRNTIAQSPDTTRPGDFIVSWDISAVVESGAGLSGVFDVRRKIDDGAWELWQARYQGTSVTSTGQDGHTYAFEVAAYDNVGNWEGFTGVAESVTQVRTQFVDTVPPGAPTNITINGSALPRWSSEAAFNVSWTSPADPSGIARIYYKFYEPPTSANDVSGFAAGSPPISVVLDSDGIVPVYFWLEDGAGNSDFRNHTQSLLKHDGRPPLISSSVVANAMYDNKWLNPDSSDQAQVRITYTEDYPDSIKLFLGGAVVQQQQTGLSAGVDQQVNFIVPLNYVNDGCYPIGIVLSDSAGNAVRDSLFVCLDGTPPENAIAVSPPHSVSGRFTITWAGDGLGDDGDGAGLSGEYDLRIRIGEGQWLELLNREKFTSYTYVGVHNNSFAFEVAAWDWVGNREPLTGTPETVTLVDTAFVDDIAPESPIGLAVAGRNPSPWQNQPVFLIEWQNPADPSGIRTAFFKYDDKPTSATDFSDSVLVENGQGLAELIATAENGQLVYVWLQDGHGNADFANCAGILLRYDATEPVIDSVRAANPIFQESWYNQLLTPEITFDVVFSEDHADSLWVWGDSLGAGSAKIITTQATDTARVRLNVADAADGAYWIKIALSDSAKNRSNIDSLQIFLDSQPPLVTHVQPDTIVPANTAISISATVSDANPLQKVELLYWQGGQRQKQSVPMAVVSDSTYQAQIPASAVSDRGLEYLIFADDGVNRNRYPLSKENNRPLAIRVQLVNGVTMPQVLAHGSDENAYRMLSFPLEIAEPTGANLLESKLGPYDPAQWRLFRWSAADSLFKEYPDVGDIRPTKAYWIITAKQNIKLATGAGATVSTVKPNTVVLKKGWNDIGLPFNFPVSWSDIIIASAIDTQKVQGPHAYTGRWIYPFENKVLQPWAGYSIYSDVDDISLVIPALEAMPQLAKAQPFAGRTDVDWIFAIKVQSSDMVDAANYFGFAKSATNKWDFGLDFIEAPEIGSYITAFFEHNDWALSATRFTTDFRPPQKGSVWEMHVVTNKPERQVRLSFKALTALPKSLQLKLVDEAAAMNIDLLADSIYTFQFAKGKFMRSFKIFAGDAEFMQGQQQQFAGLPRQHELMRNFPNPFNSSTVISYELKQGGEIELAVYNLLAQKVRQLRSGYQDKGFYQITWDARDDSERELGTGVYILRLTGPDLNYTCKMVYMR